MLKEINSLTFLVIVVVLSSSQAVKANFLNGGTYVWRPKKWPQWHVVMGSDHNGVLHGKKEGVDETGMFIFEQVGGNPSSFYLKSKKWPSWYVYMTNTDDGRIQAKKSKPGSDGQWKITKTSAESFTFSPKKWPSWYMCMANNFIGTMVGCKNDPGTQGTFTISAA